MLQRAATTVLGSGGIKKVKLKKKPTKTTHLKHVSDKEALIHYAITSSCRHPAPL